MRLMSDACKGERGAKAEGPSEGGHPAHLPPGQGVEADRALGAPPRPPRTHRDSVFDRYAGQSVQLGDLQRSTQGGPGKRAARPGRPGRSSFHRRHTLWVIHGPSGAPASEEEDASCFESACDELGSGEAAPSVQEARSANSGSSLASRIRPCPFPAGRGAKCLSTRFVFWATGFNEAWGGAANGETVKRGAAAHPRDFKTVEGRSNKTDEFSNRLLGGRPFGHYAHILSHWPLDTDNSMVQRGEPGKNGLVVIYNSCCLSRLSRLDCTS